ncbi:hypothetical protein Pcinc_038135, partial [Petrolisthes cinctipes]
MHTTTLSSPRVIHLLPHTTTHHHSQPSSAHFTSFVPSASPPTVLVAVILCLARQGKKSVSYPDLDKELVKETMGGTDLEGFGEKDVTHYDLKFLQVTPDGYLVNDENEGGLPDVAQDACQRLTAPWPRCPRDLALATSSRRTYS